MISPCVKLWITDFSQFFCFFIRELRMFIDKFIFYVLSGVLNTDYKLVRFDDLFHAFDGHLINTIT